MVYDQIVAVVDDLHPSYVKIGMLSNADIVEAVAEALGRYSLGVVLDPVIVSTTGHRLLSEQAQEVVKQRLLPLSLLVTPNIPEIIALTNHPAATLDQKTRAASHLFDYGARAVLLKGGHEEGQTKSDILFTRSHSGVEATTFTSETIATQNTHGTGCTLSSAIASNLAKGYDLETSVERAKAYISGALEAMMDLGKGSGPLQHNFDLAGEFAKEADGADAEAESEA
jgi:hydroxymethylpyrimidine/phosphomethylpyrimidine kinase